MYGLEHDEGQQMAIEEHERSLEEEELMRDKCFAISNTGKHDWVTDEYRKYCRFCGTPKDTPKLTDPDWREYHQKQQDELHKMVKEIYELFDHEFFNKLLKELGKCK